MIGTPLVRLRDVTLADADLVYARLCHDPA